MSTGRAVHRRVAANLGIGGSILGLVAGTLQALVGARIPEWAGAKQAPGSLGLLTIALSLLAGYAAHRQARRGTAPGCRAACTAALLVPGLLCFSTVGRLWYLPGPLLLIAGFSSVDSLRDTIAMISRNWLRALLALLGAAELLMAGGAAPVLMAVGAVGGAALVTAAAVARTPSALLALVVLGTVPFALLAWTAVVPVVLLLAAAGLLVPLIRRQSVSASVGP
jgi:hypothetical protein